MRHDDSGDANALNDARDGFELARSGLPVAISNPLLRVRIDDLSLALQTAPPAETGRAILSGDAIGGATAMVLARPDAELAMSRGLAARHSNFLMDAALPAVFSARLPIQTPFANGDPPATIAPSTSITWLWTNPFGDFSRGGSIDSTLEFDLYRFIPDQSGSYKFSVGSSSLDTQLRVYDSGGNAITAVIDDHGGGVTETVTKSLSTGQWYYIAVGGFLGGTGNYVVSVDGPSPAPQPTISTPAPNYTGSTSDTLNYGGDLDYFVITAPTGTNSLNLSVTPVSSLDTWVELYDSSGSLLRQINTNGDGVVDSATAISVTAGATYYVGVSGRLSTESGNYTVNVDFNPNQPPSLPDLIVQSVSVDDTTLAPGDSVGLSWTIKNKGDASAGQSTTDIALVTADLNTVVKVYASDTTSSLGAGASEPDSRTITLPSDLAPGQYYILLGADNQHVVTESDEGNNAKLSQLITVSGPPLPTVDISGSSTVDEGGTLSFTVTRSGAGTTQDLVVSYTTSGQATSGTDYQAPSGSVTITAGHSTATINIKSIDDGVDETNDNETLTLNLSSSASYGVGTSSATGTIHDINNPPVVGVSVGAQTSKIVEGGRSSFIISLSSAQSNSVTVRYDVSGSANFVAPSGSITFDPGQTTKTISIQTHSDADQHDDDVSVSLRTDPGYSVTISSASSVVVDDTHLGGEIFVVGGDITNPGRAGHLFLLYKTANGAEFIIRGGPSNPGPSYGAILIQNSWLLSESADKTNETHGRVKLDLGGRDAGDVWSVLTQLAEQISDANIPYSPLFPFQNSNNVAGTLANAIAVTVAFYDMPGFPELYPTTTPLSLAYHLDGTTHNDVLVGGNLGDTLRGLGGNDALAGGPGIDRLEGGTENDTYYFSPGSGNDTIFDSQGVDTIYYHGNALGGSYTLFGDLVGGLTGPERVGNDLVLTFRQGTTITIESYFAASGNNKVELFVDGNEGIFDLADTTYHFQVASGDLTLHGDPGAASYLSAPAHSTSGVAIDDGDGPAVANVSANASPLPTIALLSQTASDDNPFDDWLIGADGVDTLVAHDGDDVLLGDGQNDHLSGGGGDDILDGGAGADVLDGGADNAASGGLGDTAIYLFAPAGVTVSLATGTGTAGDAAGDTLTGIENLAGSDFSDDLAGNAGVNILLGFGGNDFLTGGGGDDGIDGGDGNDTAIYSGARKDYVLTFSPADSAFVLTDRRGPTGDGSDTLLNTENMRFADVTMQLDYRYGETSRTDINPDGSKAITVVDIGNLRPWHHQIAYFDTQGSLFVQTGMQDNGTSWQTNYDTTATQDWTWSTTMLDAQDRPTLQWGTYDIGVHWLRFFDISGSYSWQEATVYFDSNWNVYAVKGIRDDGSAVDLQMLDVAVAYDTALWFTTPYDGNFNAPPVDTVILGGGNVDVLFGYGGDDLLSGAGGNDTLTGGTGNDTMFGGAGDDTFVFRLGDGDDTIGDFTAGAGSNDLINLHGYGVASFAALQGLMTQLGADTLISIDNDNHLLLQNVTMGNLTAGDFVLS